jgi:hypothetical protein
MNTFDLSPLWQSTVGFDRLTNLMEDSVRRMGGDNYPPYDIERVGEDHYQISLALAGLGTCWRSKVARPRRAATSISTKASLRVRSVGCSLWLRAGEGSLVREGHAQDRPGTGGPRGDVAEPYCDQEQKQAA